MIDREEAHRRVAVHVNTDSSHGDDRLIVCEEDTIDKPYGWVVFYTSEKWLATGDFRYAIAGNGPIVVLKDSGEMIPLGTARPVEDYLLQIESGETTD